MTFEKQVKIGKPCRIKLNNWVYHRNYDRIVCKYCGNVIQPKLVKNRSGKGRIVPIANDRHNNSMFCSVSHKLKWQANNRAKKPVYQINQLWGLQLI